MKCGTKLKFKCGLDTIEDFFLGGKLPKNSDGKYIHPTYKDYVLIDDDVEKISKVELYPDNTPKNIGLSIRYPEGEILSSYDLDLLKQNLECRCATIRGELPYDTRLGIPLKTVPTEIELAILDLVKSTAGVKNCDVVARTTEVVGSKRVARFKLNITTVFGDIQTTV